jgi:hypothetical protein
MNRQAHRVRTEHHPDPSSGAPCDATCPPMTRQW